MDQDDEEFLCDCGDDECPECNPDCWQCGGEGCGVTGDDWSVDPLWEQEGVVADCPCCRGSGKAKDCTYW